MDWEKENNKLIKIFVFHDFVGAIHFINKIVPYAEDLQHHPDIEIFDYKNVKITLTTHSKKKITEKDYQLAKKIDQIT
ncbi:4a-hydroxytetrahydrobiopterin dehydratase [Candidatus Woesearchaeota archaeon]|nr:4a-hydroxytetrahydrobiopterin dehydratase [Candidatus Woesearchaeota archaeon]